MNYSNLFNVKDKVQLPITFQNVYAFFLKKN